MQKTEVNPQVDLPLTRQPDPEWLDELPAQDRRAIRSRKDLQRINGLMRHVPLMAEVWRRNKPDRWIETIVELGAGDGTFLLKFARAIARESRPFKVLLVDRVALPEPETLDGFRALGWEPTVVTSDAFEWLAQAQVTEAAFVCNLFLHHFPQERLKLLLEHSALRASFFLALEPRRSFAALAACRFLGLIGCNDVTRHDAVVSVRAGFCDSELSALWPQDGRWELHEHAAIPFTHCFVAHRSG
jgi:hypothetical protein